MRGAGVVICAEWFDGGLGNEQGVEKGGTCHSLFCSVEKMQMDEVRVHKVL